MAKEVGNIGIYQKRTTSCAPLLLVARPAIDENVYESRLFRQCLIVSGGACHFCELNGNTTMSFAMKETLLVD